MKQADAAKMSETNTRRLFIGFIVSEKRNGDKKRSRGESGK
jgi:hypothetical protein